MSDQLIGLTAADLRILLERAREAGIIDRWAAMAIEWIDKADQEIARLRKDIT